MSKLIKTVHVHHCADIDFTCKIYRFKQIEMSDDTTDIQNHVDECNTMYQHDAQQKEEF